MSVDTSSAPPPLLFGQQGSPTPPAFTSPPLSPSHTQFPTTHPSQTPQNPPNPQHPPSVPASAPPPAVMDSEDIDMSTSTTLPPPPGQNHDREDAEMGDAEPTSSVTNPAPATNTDIEIPPPQPATTEDAMDTTPDDAIVASTGDNGSNAVPPPAPDAPITDGHPPPPPPPAADGSIPPQDTNGNTTETTGDVPVPAEGEPVPAPGSPRPEETQPTETQDSDSSEDSDDDTHRWHEILEDTSEPNEHELKDIEDRGEFSATDHSHWESLAFMPFVDPEYKPGVSGRIEWPIDPYNGTKERPNKEIVMRSPIVQIGGYDWQVKFYPRGNDTDFLSVYVENVSLDPSPAAQDDSTPAAQKRISPVLEERWKTAEDRHTPLAVMPGVEVTKARPSCLAQISVILYNPSEPRVNYHHTAMHRFTPTSPDWGWTRFHGPYFEIQNRQYGQRQALLRGDKLAMTAYIRLVEDETGVLGEHEDATKAKWDSWTMTGLQALRAPPSCTSAHPGGNLISALASWMLLKPFRQFLYDVRVTDPVKEARSRPMPVVRALQTILYSLRTRVEPGAGPVNCVPLIDALDWYGIDAEINKLDVIPLWEILRGCIDRELAGTPWEGRFVGLFGLRRDRARNVPTYKVPVKDVETVEAAIAKAPNFLLDGQELPQVLNIELERQEFDESSRQWRKLVDTVKLDDHVRVRDVGYTLYGFVAHTESLQSNLYYPVLRPEGPESKWYQFCDGRGDGPKVTCLNQREAIQEHEGYPASKARSRENSKVAYILMYVRDDVSKSVFSNEEPEWDVPEWLVTEVKNARTSEIEVALDLNTPPPAPVADSEIAQASITTSDPEPTPAAKDITFQVIDSRVYLEHDGPGIWDAYSSKWAEPTPYIFDVTVPSNCSLVELREAIAKVAQGVEEPRQCKFWLVNSFENTIFKPTLITTGSREMSCGTLQYTEQLHNVLPDEMRIWLHVVPVDELPPPPPPPVPAAVEEPKPEEPAVTENADLPPPPAPESDAVPAPPPVETSEQQSAESTDSIPPPPVPAPATITEDTPMSDADDATPAIENNVTDAHPPPPPHPDILVAVPGLQGIVPPAMDGDVPVPAPPPAFDFNNNNNAINEDSTNLAANEAGNTNENSGQDTEMGGTQDNAPPPPAPTDLPDGTIPPPIGTGIVDIISPSGGDAPIDWAQPPPPPPGGVFEPVYDYVYFFLKFFNVEEQRLESKGSFVAKTADKVDATVLKILGLPDDTALNYYDEEDIVSVNTIRRRRSFAHEDVSNATIIIAQPELNEDEIAAFTVAGKCADPQSFLQRLSSVRNFPEFAAGSFTLDNFSTEFYAGEIVCHQPNGTGTRISHDNTQYSGAFVQGARHGHGRLTYANGDVYDGDFVHGLPHGHGVLTEAATGNVYEGGWKAGKKHGEGVTRWKVAQETDRVCRICWEEEAEAAFWDCGHVVACLGCARRVDICPVCRKRVMGSMKLYFVS